jgi:hypothetical protein
MRREKNRIETVSDDIASGRAVTLSAVEAFRLLELALREKVDHVPDGWFTTQQYADAAGIALPTANHQLKRGVDLQVFETQKFRIRCGSSVRLTPHYRARNEKNQGQNR